MTLVANGSQTGRGERTERKNYARTPTVLELPRLTEVQLHSFEWFKNEGCKELFAEISPITSFNKSAGAALWRFLFWRTEVPGRGMPRA